jgi:DNA-binding transcriptional ArsR family regulator
MSLGVEAARHRAELRALAHPIRLRILSLLTGATLTAAEVARELELTHANASYHLRHLLAGGIISLAGEERIRGGVAKRYRYDVDAALENVERHAPDGPTGPAHRLVPVAFADELRRRSASIRRTTGNYLADAELWVDPEVWLDVRNRIAQAGADLHRAARAPRSAGAIRTSTTIALFEMAPDEEPS